MPAVQLKHGSKLRFNGLPYQVIGRTAETDKILLLNDDTLEELRLSQNEIASEIAKCRLELIPDVSGSSEPELLLEHLQKDPINLSEKASSEYKRRSEYLKAINEINPRFYSAPYIKPVVAAVAEKLVEAPPSLSTIYRWRREYLAANCDYRALTPGYSRRGNRKRRLHPFVIRVIEDAINTNYLVQERPPVAQLVAAVISTIAKRNRELQGEATIPLPSDRTIYRAVAAIAPDYCVQRRHGKAAEYIRFHAVQASPKTRRVLERWEMDHCKLDLYAIDDDFGSPYGRPWLTTIIDVYSGMIAGFHLSFEQPNKQSAMSALMHAVLSKTEHLKRYPDIKNRWEAYGVPTTLVVDNGEEFHSTDFVAACHYLGTTIQYAKARSPWLKGTVERHFGSLNRSLLAGMKGYTFPDTKSKGDYDPKKNAVIGLRKLEELLYHWIVDLHNQRAKRNGLGIPALLWRESVRRFPIPHVSSAKDIGAALLCSETRILTRNGIEFYGMDYNSPEMEAITRMLGEDISVIVKFDPGDISAVHIIHPASGVPITLRPKESGIPKGLTLWKQKKIMKYAKSLNTGDRRVALAEARAHLYQKALDAAAEAKPGAIPKNVLKFLRDTFDSEEFAMALQLAKEPAATKPEELKIIADPAVTKQIAEHEEQEIASRLGDDDEWGSSQR